MKAKFGGKSIFVWNINIHLRWGCGKITSTLAAAGSRVCICMRIWRSGAHLSESHWLKA